MKNRYGGPLRELVVRDFHLKIFVDMVDTPAFQSDVVAYPAVTVIGREKTGSTRIARRPEINQSKLLNLSRALTARKSPDPGSGVTEVLTVGGGGSPWILELSDRLSLVRRLESELPTIEETGCRVGIGVATGADKAFIGPYEEMDVEPSRKLPMATTRDIETGTVRWRGLGVINPFGDDGGLVDLSSFPRLHQYLKNHQEQIAARHIARKNPVNWFRTIDRIYPALAATPKLLIPDIKGEAHIVYEDGRLYPHHNLYYLTSDTWDIHALRGVLVSGIARLFIETYSTKMRGGYLRFQAQYLRRIRLPRWENVPASIRDTLVAAARANDLDTCNDAVSALFGLTTQERAALKGIGKNVA
jgi:hypothetical protein